ncbi:hypothetical protein [Bosea sp. BK604]|uniref:hypothetical protein n=1 Tax=Bosea sp. BK604 TaxID=2512180 RepID=UPI00104B76BD|nr:hypothetical protein [Bosea sp. BK604]TCR68517.1 hypothetical protein EV560_102346 [Bosea sp. BK604]
MSNIFRAAALGLAALSAGCAGSSRVAVPTQAPTATASKHIANDGAGGLVLPDGTRVATDATGGFTLPNGSYVRRDASGALNLPNGARCLPDGRSGGYNCP